MTAYRAQVVLHTVDNVQANYLTNSWAFDMEEVSGEFTDVETALDTFYSSWLNNYGAKGMSGTGHEIKWYLLPGSPPNYPVRTVTFDTGANPSSEPLPSEVALCLSFQGSKAAGFPQARRRGRIYMGTVRQTASVDGRPSSTIRTALTGYASTFKATIDGLTSATTWGVWSSTDQDLVPVANGWVDDVWDTQRRRGLERTVRTIWA